MKANRRVDTKPERVIRSLLHARGLRFRKDYPVEVGGLRVRPDIVFTRARVAVFIDGCFWHHCPEHGETPVANRAFWEQKFARNQARDRRVDHALREDDWIVLRLWEHEAPEAVADEIRSVVGERRGYGDHSRSEGADGDKSGAIEVSTNAKRARLH